MSQNDKIIECPKCGCIIKKEFYKTHKKIYKCHKLII